MKQANANQTGGLKRQPVSKVSDMKTLTGTALLLAVMGVLQVTGLGFLPITATTVTIMQLPTIIAVLSYGLPSGLVLGLGFGLLSMYSAYTTPTLLSAPFMNPLVAVLPRLLIPLLVYLLARALRYEKSASLTWKAALLGAVGSLLNTIGVLTMLGLLYGELAMEMLGQGGLTGKGMVLALAVYGASSGLPEAGVCAALTAAVMAAFGKLRGQKKQA